MKKSLLLLAISTLILSCKTGHYTPATYKNPQIIAGSSGGVTGTIREYALFENGQLFMSKGIEGQWKALKNVKGSKVRAIFKKAEDLRLDTVKFNAPGNMTYYLIWKSPGVTNEIKWGQPDQPVSPAIKAFYQELVSCF